jgi:hypothetical protein
MRPGRKTQSEDLTHPKDFFHLPRSFLSGITQDQMPEFPEIKYELRWRNTLEKGSQKLLIDEVKKISYKINPKICIRIKPI